MPRARRKPEPPKGDGSSEPGPRPFQLQGRLRWKSGEDLPLLFVDHLQVLSRGGITFLTFGRTDLPPELTQEVIEDAKEHGIFITPIVRLAISQQTALSMVDVMSRIVQTGQEAKP